MFGRKLLRCSFCGKDETQISKLVAGPRVYICDACVAIARNIMDNSNGGDHLTRRVTPSRTRRLLGWIKRFVTGGDVQHRIGAGAA